MIGQLAHALVFALVLSASTAPAAEIEVSLAPSATRISFTLDATLHTVRGVATAGPARVTVDPTTGQASGEIVVAATSAETGNSSRDEKMHADVLRSREYSSIVLRPRRIDGDLRIPGQSDVTLVGELELLGSPHAIEIPLRLVIEGHRVQISARFAVPYVEWGLKDPSKLFLRVAKTVMVTVEAEGRLNGVGQ